jgi:hypothetical protein
MILVTDHARDNDGRNVHPLCNSCVDKGLEQLSYEKAQISVATANKRKGTNTIIITVVWGENKYMQVRKSTRRRACALLSVHGADLDIKI